VRREQWREAAHEGECRPVDKAEARREECMHAVKRAPTAAGVAPSLQCCESIRSRGWKL